MASTLSKAPLLRTASIRGYAKQCPKAVPVGGTKDYEVKCSVLPTKLAVASADNDAAISRVSVLFKAGSRYETPDNVGVSHVLRIAAGLTTKCASQFAITRNLQEVGAKLTCSTDREVVAYTLECSRASLENALPYLAEVSCSQIFRPWEISDNENRLRLELATRPPQLRAIDLLHKAAYRNRGLGNSLYIAKYNIGKISTETLQHYVGQNFAPERAAVVGLGISTTDILNFAKKLPIAGSGGAESVAPYKGGEIRSDKGGDLAHIAIAGQGGSLTNAKDALAFAVLQRALGAGGYIVHNSFSTPMQNSERNGLLSKCIGEPSPPTSITGFNVSYSDSGLCGALISAPAEKAGEILSKVVETLKNASISDAEVQKGKNQLKAAVQYALECGTVAIEDIGNQTLLLGCVANASQIACAIDALSTADIQNAFKKLGSGKFSMASVGNLKTVQFLDDLVK